MSDDIGPNYVPTYFYLVKYLYDITIQLSNFYQNLLELFIWRWELNT